MSRTGFRRGVALPTLVLIFAIMNTSCQENHSDLNDGLYAEFVTDRGEILVELYPQRVPLTVINFVGLAEGKLDFANKKAAFYDGLTFHRVIEDFMIQGGDPQGNGSGGPGYQFPDEIDSSLLFDKPGVLAMANAGPDTNGSQFFITHVPTPWLQGKHAIFGQVIEGQEVVNAIKQGDKLKKLNIIRVGGEAATFKADEQAYRELESNVKARRATAAKEAKEALLNEIAERWPDAVLDEKTGIYPVVRSEGTGPNPPAGTKITVHYTGTLLNGTEFDSSRQRNEPFQFNVGKGQVIPGWDASLLGMKKGERRIIILPPDMGYGSRGIGPIPPDSWLVFDVELLDF